MYQILYVEVHPRSRGEYLKEMSGKVLLLGSPPLTRGIHRSGKRKCFSDGFTPAHAGNTGQIFA